MASEQFSLCWDNFHKNMSSGMNSLLENEDLVDVTLAVEGKILKAHKMVLSVCSPYFKELFKSNPCKHPIVFMKDVSYVALSDLLQFMYQGEVQVSQENLTTFIKTAEALQIKGLTGDGNGSTDEVPETTHEDRTSHHVETAPITVPRPKKIAPSPLATPPSKRQRTSTSFESTPMPQPQITTKTEPVSSAPSSTDQMIQFKMEPHDQTQSMLQDDNAEDTFGDDQIEDNNAEDVEEYSMMEGNEEEPQAGTSTETAGEGQGGSSKHSGQKGRSSPKCKPYLPETFDLVEILKHTTDGKNILASLSLSPSLRNKLVTLIINNELKSNPKSNISSQRFTQLAQYIVKLFPEETVETYYSLQRKATDGAHWSPKGKLYEKYITIKKQLKKSLEKGVKNKNEIDAQANIKWLKTNSQPWPEVVEKWAKTTKCRLDCYCKSDCTIAHYIESYPAFQEKLGYTLFEIDFKNLHEDKSSKLVDSLPILSKKILLYANKCNDNMVRKYLDMVKTDGPEEIKHAVSFLILPYLLSPPLISTGFTKKRKWRPSKQESQENFLLHVNTKQELKPALQRRQKKCEEMQESCQPLPIIVGNIESASLEAFIEVNNILFNVENTLKCVDVCYKLFHCLNANYPPESIHVWHFMQKYVYEMTTIYDKDYPCVNTLISELNSMSV